MPRICIDPGHNSSGFDTGAQGNGLLEQDITLNISLRLKPLLEANGIQVVMTRTGCQVAGAINSVTDSLRARCDIANNAVVDLFVAIHVNAGGGTGSEVWVVSTGGRAEKAANAVLARLIQSCGWHNRGVKTASDYVLKYTDAPAILTENGFIDSASDSAKLKDPVFIHALAVAHAKGICDYFGIQYKEKVVIDVLDVAVLLFTKDDYFAGGDVALKYNCALFIRPLDKSVPKDAMSAKTLIVVGGPKTGHPNEVFLSGLTKFDTATVVGKYLGQERRTMGKGRGSCSARQTKYTQNIADGKITHIDGREITPELRNSYIRTCDARNSPTKSSNMDDGGTTVTTTNESVEVASEDIYDVKYIVKNYENSRGNPDTLQNGLMKAETLIELIREGKMRSATYKGVIG